MTQAGAYVKDEVCRALIVLITNAPELHGYAVRTMYRNLHAYQVCGLDAYVAGAAGAEQCRTAPKLS